MTVDFMRVVGVVLIYLGTVKAQNDPTNVACTVLSSSSIQFTWTQPTNTAVNGYHLAIERIDGIVPGTSIPSIVLSSYTYVSYTYSGLGNYAQYNLTIHSYIGGTNYTDVSTTCTTSEDAPNGAPFNFNCTAISTSEITCVWDALQQAYWNGVLIGYRIQWLGSNTSAIYSANVSDTVYTYTVTGLAYDTRHIFLLCGFTSVNYGTVYSTDVETTLVLKYCFDPNVKQLDKNNRITIIFKTPWGMEILTFRPRGYTTFITLQGATTTPVENITRYYCYEAVPGYIEFSWDEMPCTIYSGTIGGLMLLSMLLLTIMCCQACCQKPSPGLEINMIGGTSRGQSRNSSQKSGDDDDGGSTTETDDEGDVFEEDVSDSEHQEGAESVKPGSAIGTPSSEPPADLELSDSDYNSDTDGDELVPPETANKKRAMKMKTFSKTKILTAHATIEQTPNLTYTNELEEQTDCTKKLDGVDDETESIYEDWNPDTSNKTGSSNIKAINESISEQDGKSDKFAIAVGHGKVARTKSTAGNVEHNRSQFSDWDDDDIIERTASVSSILVDTQEDAFDSIWSPDINDRNRIDNPNGYPVHNSMFRTTSSMGMKDEPLTIDTDAIVHANKPKMKSNVAGAYDEKNNIFVNSVTYDVRDTTDNLDHITLIEDRNPSGKNRKSALTRNFKSVEMTEGSAPAWLSKRQRDELRKTNTTTPVQEVKMLRKSTVIDIEPILGSDRLVKKFPFLNLENNSTGQKTNTTRASVTSAWGQPTSKTNGLLKVKTRQKMPIVDTTITVMNDSIPTVDDKNAIKTDSESAKVKDKNQIFYGFGLGRFRKAASNWLNKMRIKKSNVKLANSKWD